VTHISDSLEEELLEARDIFIFENKYPNRSQELRALTEKNRLETKMEFMNFNRTYSVEIHYNKDI